MGNASFSAPVPSDFVNGQPEWIRVLMWPGSGTGQFYVSNDGVNWTLRDEFSFTPVPSGIYDGTAPLEIGRKGGVASGYFTGDVYYIEIRDGVNGPIATKLDFRSEDQATWSSGSSWSDGYGHTWTANNSPVYTPPTVPPPPPPNFTATADVTGTVELVWTGGATLNIDHRVNSGAWIYLDTVTNSPYNAGPYNPGDLVEFRMENAGAPGIYTTNFVTIPTSEPGTRTRINAAGPLIAETTGDWESDEGLGGDPNTILRLDGTAGTKLTIPDSAALSFDGDFEIRIKANDSNWDASSAVVYAAKGNNTFAGNSTYIFGRSATGFPYLKLTDDGTTVDINATGASKWTLTDNTDGWIAVRYKAVQPTATGEEYSVSFHQSTDGANFTPVGADINGTPLPASLYDSSLNVTIGATNDDVGEWTADIKRLLFTSVATPVLDVDFTNETAGASTVTASSGQTVTLAGAAALVNDGWENTMTATFPTDWDHPSPTISGLPAGIPLALFESERYSVADQTLSYAFYNLDSGEDYQLRLIMAEQYFGAGGERVFGAEVNGVVTHASIDAAAAVGANAAYILESTHQPDTNNQISVSFFNNPDNPFVNAIELIRLGGGSPPTTPVAATGFTATAVSASQIDLAWTDNATNEETYRIERSLDNATWSLVAVLGADFEAYSDQPLSPNTQYYYRVRPELTGATPPAWATANATTDRAVSTTGVPIPVGANPQSIIDQYAPGSTFIFDAGTHRGWTVQCRAGDTYSGAVAADGSPLSIINGGTLLTGWVQDGTNRWRKDGMTQPPYQSGVGQQLSNFPRAYFNHELFYDGERLHHAGSLADLQSAPPTSPAAAPTYSWFFSYATDAIYTNAPNPNSHTVELADTEHAFTGSVANVTIEDLVVQNYRNPAQKGAIDPGSDTPVNGWEINNVTVRHCHGTGIKIRGNNWKVRNTRCHNNGQMGIGSGQSGYADTVEIFNCEFDHNNVAGYNYGWEAGGSKLVRTKNLTVHYSIFRHNFGPGLWTDIDNVFYEAAYNQVHSNYGPGIFHEIGFDADIHHNNVYSNGFGYGTWGWGGGVVVASSPNVNVYDNYVYDNHSGIVGIEQDRSSDTSMFPELTARSDFRQTKELYVHHNDVRWSGGINGLVEDYLTTTKAAFFRGGSWNNRFDDNDYYGNTTPNGFTEWEQATNLHGGNFVWWQARGHDATSAGVRDGTPAPDIPAGFAATPLGPDSIQLDWSAAANATRYRLEYNDLGFAGGFGFLVVVTGVDHTHSGLEPETTYYYRLRSEN